AVACARRDRSLPEKRRGPAEDLLRALAAGERCDLTPGNVRPHAYAWVRVAVEAQNESVPCIEITATSRSSSACCSQVPSGLRGATPHPRSVPANVPEALRNLPVPPRTFVTCLIRTVPAQVCEFIEPTGAWLVLTMCIAPRGN